MSRIFAVMVGACAVVALVGCGNSAPRTRSASGALTVPVPSSPQPSARQANADGNDSYVGRASNAVIFVRWTKAPDGSIQGDLSQALVSRGDQAGPAAVDTRHIAFTGAVNGSNVTLTLNQGLGSSSNLTGTLSSGRLDLDYPGTDGNIITVAMRQAPLCQRPVRRAPSRTQ